MKLEWFNKSKTINRITKSDDVGVFLAQTWATIFNKYVPADKVILADSYRIEPFAVTYYQPYSYYQWYGISASGHPLNYQKDKHMKATSHWEEQASREKGKEVAESVYKYLRMK